MSALERVAATRRPVAPFALAPRARARRVAGRHAPQSA